MSSFKKYVHSHGSFMNETFIHSDYKTPGVLLITSNEGMTKQNRKDNSETNFIKVVASEPTSSDDLIIPLTRLGHKKKVL